VTRVLHPCRRLELSGVFKGGHSAMFPSFGPTMKFFLQATLYEKMRFLPFFSKNCKIFNNV